MLSPVLVLACRKLASTCLSSLQIVMHQQLRWTAKDVSISKLPSEGSSFVKPYRVSFKDERGRQRVWDAVNIHDSVAVLLYNTCRHCVILVRQFRPIVFVKMAQEKAGHVGIPDNSVNYDSVNIDETLTHELCAGIIDKAGLSRSEIARDEILEECGYNVPLERLIEITTFRGAVGVSGSTLTLFYAEVDDSMKIAEGGGNVTENENIETVECPVDKLRNLFYDESKQKPPSVMCSLLWFMYERERFLKERGYTRNLSSA